MNFKPDEKNIRSLLKSGCQFQIPRFQRDYSWEKKHYKEFLEDMINNLEINSGNIQSQQYFLGTMLFVGDFADKPDRPIEVVDGQQRLTTITILFSALSDRFKEIGKETLSKELFKYIMSTNDDGEEVRIIQSSSSYPFFYYYIQDREKTISKEPDSEEELCIQETYNYFMNQTTEKNMRKLLKKRWGNNLVDALTYEAMLKALRDQVLGCIFISIAAADKDQANKIFAILNAKGKKLASIDLIKNKIFEELKDGVNAAYADQYWEKIKDKLNSASESVGFATFYRHYWISRYPTCNASQLYDKFSKKIPVNSESYKKFLEDLYFNSENYIKIIEPKREDYDNRKEYFWLVQSLKVLDKTFGVVQPRIALLGLYDAKKRDVISTSKFKEAVLAIENFHFAFSFIRSSNTNKLEGIYSKFSIKLRACNSKTESVQIVDEYLIKQLQKLYPTFDEFQSKFILLEYSKKDNLMNVKTKYTLYKLNSYFSNNELFDDEGSVEHILPENKNAKETLNIGNLIILEGSINKDCDISDYEVKREKYMESKYTWVKQFANETEEWNENSVEERAEKLARLCYEKILDQEIVARKKQ